MTGTPMLKATGLWKRANARGTDYFAEPTAAASNSAQSRNRERTPRVARRSPYSKSHQPAGPLASAPMHDDSVADLWADHVL
jgi:hypothetical protein